MNTYPPVEVKVRGEYACFTRPDMKVERVSYPVMTPSSARGILEAIFWKPQFEWRIREIHVLKEIKHFSILRNEVTGKMNPSSAKRWERTNERFFADDHRAQRHSLVLRDVAYIVKANVFLKSDVMEDRAKFRDQFRRRVKKGQCYFTPYLGCREFTAFFSEPESDDVPIPYSSDLGLMLFDLAYKDGRCGAKPIFFRGKIDNGILNVPSRLYEERSDPN